MISSSRSEEATHLKLTSTVWAAHEARVGEFTYQCNVRIGRSVVTCPDTAESSDNVFDVRLCMSAIFSLVFFSEKKVYLDPNFALYMSSGSLEVNIIQTTAPLYKTHSRERPSVLLKRSLCCKCSSSIQGVVLLYSATYMSLRCCSICDGHFEEVIILQNVPSFGDSLV